MSGALQAVFQNQRSFGPPPGQDAYITAGTFSWVAPSGVTSVSVVAVGGGGGGGGSPAFANTTGGQGGGAGALAYANNVSVTPGGSYTVVVGSAGTGAFGVCFCGFNCNTPRVNAGASSFNTTTVAAGGGKSGNAGTSSCCNCGGTVIHGTGYAG